jgi:probable rRNA maturation factor
MIVFNKEVVFQFQNEDCLVKWIGQVVEKENYSEGELSFIFCSDAFLLEKNIEFLKHDTLTDIISFDYTIGSLVSGDIFISIERVKENAAAFKVSFEDELHRVMVHGVLHYCGYKDNERDDKELMRSKEDYYLSLRQF